MELAGNVRIDKWLWAVRVFKTRTLAAAACRAGHVRIAGEPVKPSRFVKVHDVISAKIGPITKTVQVLALIENRVGAQLAKEYAEDQTPEAEYEKLRQIKQNASLGPPKGWGRPTKKNRRDWEKFVESARKAPTQPDE